PRYLDLAISSTLTTSYDHCRTTAPHPISLLYLHRSRGPRALHSFPTRRSSDLAPRSSFTIGLDTPEKMRQKVTEASAYTIQDQEIGRAHVLTPVTSLSRMPSSA